MDHTEAERLLRPHADGTVSVPVLYDTERKALAYALAEPVRLRAEIDRVCELLDEAGIPDHEAATAARVAVALNELQALRMSWRG